MGGIFGSSAPKPPDPAKVAAAQTKSNIETAQEQARLGMTGQTSDFGSLSYVADPNSPSGYRAVSTLSPEDQALLAQQRDIRANVGGVTNTSLNNVNAAIAQPFDLSAARGTEISDIQKTFLDPQWDNQQKQLENHLLNQGIRPGSDAYINAMRQFQQQRDDAYNKMFLDAFSTANQAALTQRNLPLTDYATLAGTLQPVTGEPAPINTPSPGVATTPVGQYIYDSYNAQANQAAQNNAGLYGLIGTVGSAIISDRRMKKDILPVGMHPNGLTIYAFRYRNGDDAMHLGFIAQEVANVRPDAVSMRPDGVLMVDYGRLL